jgi:hypothetical protein
MTLSQTVLFEQHMKTFSTVDCYDRISLPERLILENRDFACRYCPSHRSPLPGFDFRRRAFAVKIDT